MKVPTPAIWLVVIVLIGLNCAEPPGLPTSTPDLATATIATTEPDRPTVTATARNLTPSATLTESPTIPAPTIIIVTESTSPTPTALSAQPTSGIIIVTPLGGEHYCDFTEAYFTPTSRMNVRNAANLNATIVGYLEIGQRQPVCDEVNVGDQTWLCLDIVHDLAGNPFGSDCGRVVAYRLGSTIYGELLVVQP